MKVLPPALGASAVSQFKRPGKASGSIAGRTVFALFVALAGASFVPSVPAASGAGSRLEAVGDLPYATEDVIFGNDRAHQITVMQGGPGKLSLSLFDADTLTLIQDVHFFNLFPQARPRIYAADATVRLLHLVVYASSDEQVTQVNPLLLTLDLDSLEATGPPKPLLGLVPAGFTVVGMTLSGSRQLFLALQPPAIGQARTPGDVLVAAIDPLTGEDAWNGPHPVRACQAAISEHTQTQVVRVGDSVFVGCAPSGAILTSIPTPAAIAVVDMADPQAQRVHYLPGLYSPKGDMYFDRVAKRLVLVAKTGRGSVWIFDLRREAFVGQVAAGDLQLLGAGINPSNGHLYISVHEALLIGSDRGIEIPQAQPFDLDARHGPIAVFPFNGTVLIPLPGPGSRLYRDPLSDDFFSPGHLIDYRIFDGLRADTPQFVGDAQAFGFRLHQVGGAEAILENLAAAGGVPGFVVNRTEQFQDEAAALAREITGDSRGLDERTRIKDGDRDIHAARVRRAGLSQDDADADAVSIDRDANTDEDYRTIAGRSNERGADLPPTWPFPSAACRDFGGGAASDSAEGSRVSCDQTEGSVSAEAMHDGLETDLVSIAAARSTVSIARDLASGVAVTVHAETRNVTIARSVRIGYMFAQAAAAAAGRPGSAKASYARRFEDVSTDEFSCASDCKADEVLAALSTALGSQFRVELPAYVVEPTAGGTHSRVAREDWEHQQDIAVNNQDPIERQVPALRLTYIGDRGVASRAILDFAAVAADATSLRLVPPLAPANFVEPTTGVSLGDIDRIMRGARLERSADAIERIIARPGRLLRPGHGWKLLFGTGPRSAALWAMLLAPLALAVRRRCLLRLVRDDS